MACLQYLTFGIVQICSVSKDCCFVQKLVPCCSTTFAYITSVLLAMRLVTEVSDYLTKLCRVSLYHLTINCYDIPLLTMQFISLPLLHRFLQESLQLGAPLISVDAPLLSADDLADQIVEVLNFFG